MAEHDRRRALRRGHWQGALWSIGNGLTTGSLVTYLALDLGARGYDLGLILAWQQLVGLARLVAPTIVRRFGGPRSAFVALSLASYLLLVALPVTVAVAGQSWSLPPVPTLVVVLCVHQLLESLGAVALWAWWADVVPRRLRGRYFSWRGGIQLAVLIPTTLASGRFVDFWRAKHPDQLELGYALVTGLGVASLLASVGVFWWLSRQVSIRVQRSEPARNGLDSAAVRNTWRAAYAALWQDRSLVWLVMFGAWFSWANGLTQTAQQVYPKQILKIDLFTQQMFVALLRLGQIGYGLAAGAYVDRVGLARSGNRRVLVVSQLVQAVGLLFFFIATPAQPYWLAGAWIAWWAFAGINLCGPNLLLRLAPTGQSAAYFGAYLGVSGAAYAVGTLTGGWGFEQLKQLTDGQPFGLLGLDFYRYLFLAGWLVRSLAVVFLAGVREPSEPR